MKKFVSLLGIFFVTLGVFAGCGNDRQKTENSTQNISTMQSDESAQTENVARQSEGTTDTADNGSAQAISQEDAINIVLKKVEGATKSDVRIHTDTEDGRKVYEGSLVYKGIEYDFEIDANLGTILEWESESVHD